MKPMRRSLSLILTCAMIAACSRSGRAARPTATPAPPAATATPAAAATPAPAIPTQPGPPTPTLYPVSGLVEPLSEGSVRLSTADGLSLTLSAGGQVTALTLNGEPLPIAPALPLQVRDLTAAAAPQSPNLLANAGFEDGLAHWALLRARDVTLEPAADAAHEGAHSLAVRGEEGSQGAIISDPIPVIPGARYRVSGHFLADFGYVGAGGPPAFWQDSLYTESRAVTGLYLQWLDAGGAPLDDLPELAAALHKNAQAWHKLNREVIAPAGAATVQIIAGAQPLAGTVWIDDLAWMESTEPDQPLAGALEVSADHVTQQGELAGLQVTVTYRPRHDHIAITVQLTDPAGTPRAFDASWGLPLDVTGWRWWDSLRESRPVSSGEDFAHAVSADITGYLPVSLYPYAVVEDGGHGLALALALDSPRYVLLHYDGQAGRLEGRAHLGISPAAAKLNNSADFTLLLYHTDPAWGLRAAAEKHAAIGPGWYKENPAWLADFTDFAQGSFGVSNPDLADFNAAGIYTAHYTVFEINVPVQADDLARPSLERAFEALDQLASERGMPAYRTAGVCDSAGEMHLKTIGVFPWAPGEWTAIFAVNPDPDLPAGYGETLLDHLANWIFPETTAAGLTVNGIEIDNFIATTMVDLCPEHLATAALPLTYDPNTYQPGVHVASAAHAYLAALREVLDAQPFPYRAISVNFRALAIPNLLSQYLDGLPGEGKTVTDTDYWNPSMLDYHLATAMGRFQAFSNHDANLNLDQIETYAHESLFYGVRATQGERGSGWDVGWEDILAWEYAQLKPLLLLGWQPVTHAWTDAPDVWVERFGSRAFTVHNWGDAAANFTLTIDLAALNQHAAGLAVTDSVSGETIATTLTTDGNLQLSGHLEPGRTAVYWLGTE